MDMLTELIGDKSRLGVLQTLRARGAMRFCALQLALRLNPAQLDRALKRLRKEGMIDALRPGARPEYALSARGEALVQAYRTFEEELYRRRSELGPAAVEPPQTYRPGPAAGGIARAVRVSPISRHGAAAAQEYRYACLRLSPEERIRRLREHSARIKALNPPAARARGSARTALRITHDAF